MRELVELQDLTIRGREYYGDSWDELTDRFIESLRPLQKLERLALRDDAGGLTEQCLRSLAEHKLLKVLSLRCERLSDAWILLLGDLPPLDSLELNGWGRGQLSNHALEQLSAV